MVAVADWGLVFLLSPAGIAAIAGAVYGLHRYRKRRPRPKDL